MESSPSLNDPRLVSPQCLSLIPIETLHENPWFIVRNRGGYYTTEYRQRQVIVLPVVDHNFIVMVRVRRPVISDVALELPAGSILDEEQPAVAAARELLEETGLEINELNRFEMQPPIAGSPNRNPVLLYVFQVNISMDEFKTKKGHDQEVERVELITLDVAASLICTGRIYVAVPCAVISRLLLSTFALQRWKWFSSSLFP
jgi:8-oxo-dGTP pyrophosphatase MutT (NUDIX family)